MYRCYCDLCNTEIAKGDDHLLCDLPIATIENEDIYKLDILILCDNCTRKLYEAIIDIASKECLERLKQIATDTYENEM